jgi:hypothetical protein
VVQRRAGGGGNQGEAEQAPGERRGARHGVPQAPQSCDADDREGQVAQHVGRVRHAEGTALIGKGVVARPLRNGAVRGQRDGEQSGQCGREGDEPRVVRPGAGECGGVGHGVRMEEGDGRIVRACRSRGKRLAAGVSGGARGYHGARPQRGPCQGSGSFSPLRRAGQRC